MAEMDLVERIALKIAIANNGGEWAVHYTEKQKNVWRQRARDLIAEVLTSSPLELTSSAL